MRLDKSYNSYKGSLSKETYFKVITTIFRVIKHQMGEGHKNVLLPKLRIKYLGIFEPSIKKIKKYLETNKEEINGEHKQELEERIKNRFRINS